MTQEDERIARKLLDLTSRGDRVQIRNGMTYLDGFALGNGTVEISRQVVRDRRRRDIPEKIMGTVAVLYSVVVGAMREFWVKTARADVKVHEIPISFEFTPTTSIGGVGSSATFSGTVNEGKSINLLKDLTGIAPVGGYFRLTGTYSFNWTGPSSRPGGNRNSAWTNETVDQDGQLLPGRVGWSSFFGLNTSSSGTWGNDVLFRMPPSSDFLFTASDRGLNCIQAFWPWNYISPGVPYAASATWSLTVTISEYFGPSTVANTYASWISNDGNDIFITVKDSHSLDCGFTPAESISESIKPTVDGIEFQKLSLLDDNAVGTFYEQGDTVLRREANWRNVQEAFTLLPLDSEDSCIDSFANNPVANLIAPNIYSINLNQVISGSTLRNRLQTSPDTVAATLTTQTATNEGESCTLGTSTESTVQVPSPGRGTIEGITYIP